ncbi:MAG: PDZ domain-containing protein [Cyanobacteria bacterium SZAS TMP-1]|nr:PDZ domain-containing protein [Cyanobacteria bacterium SZAS TMP-1]
MKIRKTISLPATAAFFAALALSYHAPARAQSEPAQPMAPLQGSVEKMSEAEDQRYQAAMSKREARIKLSAEDIRDLQIGVVGTEVVQMPGESFAIIEAVVPGLPAAEAGLKAGDLVVGGDSSVFWMAKDPTKAAWAFTGGRAGTNVAYRIVRDGEIVTINVKRINIEDITDNKLRKLYEDMARRLGPSGEGTVQLPDESQASYIQKSARSLPDGQ